ncbi:MAG: DUF2318 domain-containing protein [Oscillospiraceae bacterium]|jgi:uncharacterized membrane protein|nr:DUF2318 domain-containing protein [Oscillospiraceae bacterium]
MRTQKNRRFKALPALAALALVLVLTACSSSGGTGGAAAPTQPQQEIKQGGSLVIPLSEVSETAQFYPIVVNGTAMEVIAVTAPDGTIRTAFNTCEVCYSSGRGYYKQQGSALVCQNCGNRFQTSQVELQSSGCNPWPIFAENKTVTADSITIGYDFLAQSTQVFANWKR